MRNKFSSKKVSFGLVLIVILAIIGLDWMQNRKAEESGGGTTLYAPIPRATFKVGDEELPHTSGIYDWVKNGVKTGIEPDEPATLLKDLSYTPVSPFGNVVISFDKKPEKVEYSTWQDSYGNIPSEGLYMNSVEGNSIPIPQFPGNMYFIIHAVWEKQEAHYVVPIGIQREVPYQDFLSGEEGKFSVLEIFQDENQKGGFFEDYEPTIIYGVSGLGAQNLSDARGMAPGLFIENLPFYAVFDDVKVVFQSYSKEELIDYLKKVEEKKKE